MKFQFPQSEFTQIFFQVCHEFNDDHIPDQSAKLSFYFLLSVFPLILSAMALLGLFLQLGPELQGQLHQFLATVLPPSASDMVNKTFAEITGHSTSGKISFGLIFTLWAAAQGMLALMDGLNVAYHVRETRSFIKKHVLALGLTVICSGLVAVSFVLLVGQAHLNDALVDYFHWPLWMLRCCQVLEFLLLLFFILIAFNVLYIFAPNVRRQHWHWFMPGTITAICLWLAASFGFKLYLVFFNNYTVTYGSIGAVILLLMWFYFSGIALLVGGEVNAQIEQKNGQVRQAVR